MHPRSGYPVCGCPVAVCDDTNHHGHGKRGGSMAQFNCPKAVNMWEKGQLKRSPLKEVIKVFHKAKKWGSFRARRRKVCSVCCARHSPDLLQVWRKGQVAAMGSHPPFRAAVMKFLCSARLTLPSATPATQRPRRQQRQMGPKRVTRASPVP